MKTEINFTAVAYRGRPAAYRENLLKKVEGRLKRQRLHLVTPPGADKIVLGLELVRMMNSPCLILSPSRAQCDRWGETFLTEFLPREEQKKKDQYLSYDLSAPALLTLITYDELYATVSRGQDSGGARGSDLSDAAIIRIIEEHGICAIVLDEAHHLEHGRQSALESFMGVLGGDASVLALTTALPYDLGTEDWERFIELCGEVDEEVWIPELVKEHILCPHEDYIHISHPTIGETDGIRGYRTRVDEAVADAMTLPFMAVLNSRMILLQQNRPDYFYAHHEIMIALLTLLNEYGYPVNLKVFQRLTGLVKMAPLTVGQAELAFSYLLESQTLTRDDERDALIHLFTDRRIYDHHHVRFTMPDKVARTLAASAGKLESITAVTVAELRSLDASLRQLIFTDPLYEDTLSLIGSAQELSPTGAATVFETLRRRADMPPIGCVSRGLAILPAAVELVPNRLSADGVAVTPIADTAYALYRFDAASAVADTVIQEVTRLFEAGDIRVLLGSLDALERIPSLCFVNSLIVASATASIPEIDRIRGAVLYADPHVPGKTAHIWHLVTVEPVYSRAEYPTLRLASRMAPINADDTIRAGIELRSMDYRRLRRSFENYMGASRKNGALENGIDRLDAAMNYDVDNTDELMEGVNAINADMLMRAHDRVSMAGQWQEATATEVCPVAEVRIPQAARVPVLTLQNTLLSVLAVLSMLIGFAVFPTVVSVTYLAIESAPQLLVLSLILLAIVVGVILWAVLFTLRFLPLLLRHITATASIRSLCKSLMKAMKDLKLIDPNAKLTMTGMSSRKAYRVHAEQCSRAEQVIYQKALAELFSAIGSPRYIMVRAGWFHRFLWKWSFACPSVIGQNDISVKTFEKYIRRSLGSMKFQYTRREPGSRSLIAARNYGYLNESAVRCEKRNYLMKRE